MQDNNQPAVDQGQPPEAVAEPTQPEVAPEPTATIDAETRAAIEAELKAKIEADWEDRRFKPLQRKLSERETERQRLSKELAEAQETLARFETRMRDDGIPEDELELARLQAREAARNAPPNPVVQREWLAVQDLAQKHGIAIFLPDGSVNQDLPWDDVTSAATELEGLAILSEAIIGTAFKKRESAALAQVKAEAEAKIAEIEEQHKEELRQYQRVPTGEQGGGGSKTRYTREQLEQMKPAELIKIPNWREELDRAIKAGT